MTKQEEDKRIEEIKVELKKICAKNLLLQNSDNPDYRLINEINLSTIKLEAELESLMWG